MIPNDIANEVFDSPNDPTSIIAKEKMGPLQGIIIALCVLINALDGFDVQSISFASPFISADWHISRATLGVVLSMELIGMALGSIIIGNVADRIGRRPVILGSLMLMASGMYLAALAHGVAELSVFRLMTGIGIGGMIAAITAMVSEVSNERRRNLCITLVVAGYPAGAASGGAFTALLLAHATWRMIFVVGGSVTLVLIPLTLILMPESVPFLARKRSQDALNTINGILARMGRSRALRLPSGEAKPVVPLAALFRSRLILQTTLLSLAYFAHVISFYFVLKWLPKIMTDRGFTPHVAGGVLVCTNVGGIAGALALSLVVQWVDVRKIAIASLLTSSVAIALLGAIQGSIRSVLLIAGVAGFCIYAAISGLYALFAKAFPTEVRATGSGFVIGIGRGGSVLGPILAGILFSAGMSARTVIFLMALGSLAAAVALLVLPVLSKRKASRIEQKPRKRLLPPPC